jgi:hypothetical protein
MPAGILSAVEQVVPLALTGLRLVHCEVLRFVLYCTT